MLQTTAMKNHANGLHVFLVVFIYFLFFIGGKLEMSTSLVTSLVIVCKNNRITIDGEGLVAPFCACLCVFVCIKLFSHNSNAFISFILCPKFELCTVTRFIFLLKELKLDGLS